MSLQADVDLANDSMFVNRCLAALVSTALAVQAESAATANHAARSAYALLLLANPLGYAQRMAIGMTVDGNAVTGSTDAQLETRASAIYNAYCVQG